MRILVYLEQFSNPSETFIIDQIEWFSNHGHPVLVVCNKRKNTLDDSPFSVIEIPYPRDFRGRLCTYLNAKPFFNNSFHPSFFKSLKQVISSFSPNIIHCHFGDQAIRLIDNLSFEHIPVYINFHGYDASMLIKNNWAYRNKIKRLFSKDFIYPLFICNYHKTFFKSLSIESNNSIVVNLGINTQFFKRLIYIKDTNRYRFIQLGRLSEKKGHRYTLNAFHQTILRFPNCHLTIVGNGPLKSELQTLCKNLGIHKHVSFIDWANRNQVKHYLDNADAFVHPSITAENGDMEGIPVSIMEAMSMELPIISTFHSGIPELVMDGPSGFLVPEKNSRAIANAMATLIQSNNYYPQNREKLIHLFDIEKQNNTLLAHFKRSSSFVAK